MIRIEGKDGKMFSILTRLTYLVYFDFSHFHHQNTVVGSRKYFSDLAILGILNRFGDLRVSHFFSKKISF